MKTTTNETVQRSLARAAKVHGTLPAEAWDYVRDCLARGAPTTEQAANEAIDAALREVFQRSDELGPVEPVAANELAAAAATILSELRSAKRLAPIDDDVEARIVDAYRRACARECVVFQAPSSGPRMDAEGFVELVNGNGTLATLHYNRATDRVRFVCFGEREQGGAA